MARECPEKLSETPWTLWTGGQEPPKKPAWQGLSTGPRAEGGFRRVAWPRRNSSPPRLVPGASLPLVLPSRAWISRCPRSTWFSALVTKSAEIRQLDPSLVERSSRGEGYRGHRVPDAKAGGGQRCGCTSGAQCWTGRSERQPQECADRRTAREKSSAMAQARGQASLFREQRGVQSD